MKNMKTMKKVMAIAISGCLMFSQPVMAGGVPVFDGAAVTQAIQQGIQMKEQIDNQISQIKELQSQVKAMSGLRDVGKVARSALDTAGSISSEWADLYGKVKPSGNAANDLDGKKYSHENSLQHMLNTQQFNIKALQETQVRIDKIIELGNQAAQTKDIKAAADFANRIAVEQGYIQAMQMKLDMAERIAKQQEQIQTAQHQSRRSCEAKHIRDGNFKACR